MHPDNSLLNEGDNTARAQRANERSRRNNDTPSLALRAGEGGGLRVHRRVLREELLDARLRFLERLVFLPLQNQLRMGKKLRGFFGNRPWMRFVVARQHERRCSAIPDELTID